MPDNKYIDLLKDVSNEEEKKVFLDVHKRPNKNISKSFKNVDLEMIRSAKMALNYKEFVKGAWHTVEPKGVFLDNWHIDAICDVVQAAINKDCEMRNVIINIPPRHLLADSTPIITTKGWKIHGELKVGDRVFTPSGKSTKVIDVKPPDIADYTVQFSNGDSIKCNLQHLWTIYDNKYNKYNTVSTDFIKEHLNRFGQLIPVMGKLVFISSIEKSNYWEMGRCISIKAKDGLYRAGKSQISTHNSKTRLVSDLLTPWVWIKDPWMRFLYASYAEDLSIISSRYCRSVLQSRWYQDRWGDKYTLTATKDKDITNDVAGYRRIKSVAAGVTGQGGHVIVADDALKAQDAFSDQMRKGCNSWYDNAFSNRIEGGVIAEGIRIIIMQRLHDMDLTGHILANESVYDWYHLCLPVEYDPDTKCIVEVNQSVIAADPRTKKGEVLHPERFGKAEIEAEKGKGNYHFYSQYQQDPVPEGGGSVKAAWITNNFYHETPEYWYEHCNKLIQSWDLTFGDKISSDYVVGQLWGQRNNDIYLLDQIRARMNFPVTIQAITQMKRNWPRTQRIIIEEKANGQGMIDTLKGRIPGILPYNPQTKDKTERLAMVSWMLEAGHVHFPDPEKHKDKSNWILQAIKEITRFPAAPYDDVVDAMTQALAKLQLVILSPTNVPQGIGKTTELKQNFSAGQAMGCPSNIERPWSKRWNA